MRILNWSVGKITRLAESGSGMELPLFPAKKRMGAFPLQGVERAILETQNAAMFGFNRL
jgi:hypothetical protein